MAFRKTVHARCAEIEITRIPLTGCH
jgi:hypothetical protein